MLLREHEQDGARLREGRELHEQQRQHHGLLSPRDGALASFNCRAHGIELGGGVSEVEAAVEGGRVFFLMSYGVLPTKIFVNGHWTMRAQQHATASKQELCLGGGPARPRGGATPASVEGYKSSAFACVLRAPPQTTFPQATSFVTL